MKNAVFTLDYPFEHKGQKIQTLNLRRFTVADIEAVDSIATELSRSISLLALCTQREEEVIRSMDAADFKRLNKQVKDDFL